MGLLPNLPMLARTLAVDRAAVYALERKKELQASLSGIPPSLRLVKWN